MNQRHPNPQSITKRFRRDYLLVAILPLMFLIAIIAGSTEITKTYLAKIITQSIRDLSSDTENDLKKLGETIIQTKARDVARQVEIYFREHQGMTIGEMRTDPVFTQISKQKVGKTGYIAMYETKTTIFRVHPNPSLIDRDVTFLSEELPTWWAIFKETLEGDEVSGYYDWRETDGSIRKKYMTMTPVGYPLDGVTIMVAATTYIDEFSAPVIGMRKKAEHIVGRYRNYVSRQWMGISIVAIIVGLLTLSWTYFMGRRAASRYIAPIMQLAEMAGKLGQGKWDAHENKTIAEREDEIGTLARAFARMSEQLKKLVDSLEKQLNELNKTQEALKESELHYRSLYEGVPVGLYRTSLAGDILEANQMMVHMLGYPNQEKFMETNAENIWVDPKDRASWQERMAAGDGVTTEEVRMRKLDGTEIWMENQARVVRNDSGGIQYYEGSLKDISERKKTEAELKKSEERYKTLYEESKRIGEMYKSLIHSSPDAIIIYDFNGKPDYANTTFTEMFGWTQNEIGGKHSPYIPPSEWPQTRAMFREVMADGRTCQGFETKRTTKNGRVIDVSLSASRYNDHEGNAAGILVVLRDISENKRFEAQLQRIDRMEAIGTLAGGVAHDFNNLLMAIQGSVSLMRLDMETSHPHYQDFINIEKQINRGAKLTSQLLGYARKGKYEVKPLNLNDIVSENAETIKRTRKDITIRTDCAPDLWMVEADAAQIQQLLMNLFINASDAMPDGGRLVLETRNVASENVPSGAFSPKPGGYVLLRVEDTGSGMDAKTADRIFDPFFTTKDMGRGTGLGLSSVYGIVKGHGGHIEVDSRIGRGTVFRIFFPAHQGEDVKPQAKPQKTVKGKGCILLIDDEEQVLEVGAKMLQAIGYDVIEASGGEQAIAIFKEDPDRFDLIILDMIMPDMGGGQAFDRIREIKADADVLLSSGYSIDGKATEILNRGCRGFIQKPYNIERLSNKIKEILE